MAIGAATLADIFDPAERGTKMGLYFVAPLLGPALGPIFGGIFTQYFNWRGPFWFLSIVAGLIFVAFLLFFRDSFRKERSRTYQTIVAARIQKKEMAKERSNEVVSARSSVARKCSTSTSGHSDCEAQPCSGTTPADINLSLKDVSPIKPLLQLLRRKNNLLILLPSGELSRWEYERAGTDPAQALLFGFSFSMSYTCSRTMGLRYHYDALHIGLVLLSFGVGTVVATVPLSKIHLESKQEISPEACSAGVFPIVFLTLKTADILVLK